MPRFHSCALRKGRCSERGRAYFVTARTHARRPLFADFFCGRVLVSEMRWAEDAHLVQSLAWVVMPNHFHWLVVLEDGELQRVVGRIKSRTTFRLRKMYGHLGPLWQAGFYDQAIRHEHQLLPFARYIVANPIRAGLVRRVGDYPLWDAVWIGR
ncbi:MAG: transposase [Gammaproteobacteria bacterium]|nr:transposase [Gammaproteobacteria bacterium]